VSESDAISGPSDDDALIAASVPVSTGQQTQSSRDEREVAMKVFPGATFECVRCGSRFFGEWLAKLPELTCSNCGFRIFRKVRVPAPKTLKGE
jgi:DNA-directed RNA polymerase subunit RPC12/RpoP